MVGTQVGLDQIFDKFVGNRRIIEAVKVEIEACRRRGEPLRPVIFTGTPGTGKTTLARMVASAFSSRFVDINCGALEPGESLCEIVARYVSMDVGHGYDLIARPTILLWDESHSLSRRLQIEMLKPVLEHHMEKDGTRIDMRNVTFMFATTDPDEMIQPLRDRCANQFQMERYSMEELAEIIACVEISDQEMIDGKMVRQMYEIRFHAGLNRLISERSRFTPRMAINLMRGYYNYLRSQSDAPQEAVALSSRDQIVRFFEMKNIGEMGVSRNDVEYLRLLAENGSALGLSSIAAQIEVSENEVRLEIEPFLRTLKFVTIKRSGREITIQGKRFIQEYC